MQATAGALREVRKSPAEATANSNTSSLSQALHESAVAQASAGDFDGALLTAQVIRSAGFRDSTLADIAGVQANAGDNTGAIATMEHIEKTYFRMLVMYHVGIARAKRGNIGGATSAAARIQELWRGASDEF